jgi:hypothetical protein
LNDIIFRNQLLSIEIDKIGKQIFQEWNHLRPSYLSSVTVKTIIQRKIVKAYFWLLPKSKLRVKFCQVSGVVFLGKGSGQRAGCLTKRASDVWDSAARFASSISRTRGFGFFLLPNRVHARPRASPRKIVSLFLPNLSRKRIRF